MPLTLGGPAVSSLCFSFFGTEVAKSSSFERLLRLFWSECVQRLLTHSSPQRSVVVCWILLNLLQSGFCCCFLKQMVLLVESKTNWNWKSSS